MIQAMRQQMKVICWPMEEGNHVCSSHMRRMDGRVDFNLLKFYGAEFTLQE